MNFMNPDLTNSSLCFYDDNESIQTKETIDNYKYLFEQYYQKRPTLFEALDQMFKSSGADDKKSKGLIDHILHKVQIFLNNNFNQIKDKYPNIKIEDAQIISSYTCEIEPAYNPYKLTNTNLVKDDRFSGVSNVSKYIFLLLSTLRKLNKYYPDGQQNLLYRCIKTNVKLLDPFNQYNSYFEGNKKTFWGFTSTTISMEKARRFLKRENNKRTGTIFFLTGDIWGYDISLFNVYHETEIILEPEREFIIERIKPPEYNDGVTYVQCKILNSKVVLDNTNFNDNYTNIVLNYNLKNNSNNIPHDNFQYPNNPNNFQNINFGNNNNNQIMNNNSNIPYNMNNNYQNIINYNAMNNNNFQNHNQYNNIINNNNKCNLFSDQSNNNNNNFHIIWADPNPNIKDSAVFFNKENYQIHFFHDTPSCIQFFKNGYHQNMDIKCIITSLFIGYSKQTGNPNAFQMIEQIKRLLTNNSNPFFVMMTVNADKQQCKDFGFDLVAINDRGEMQKNVINRIKYNISFREPNLKPCLKIRDIAVQFLNFLKNSYIINNNWDKYVDRCFCQNCEPNSIIKRGGENDNRGNPEVKYSLPIGWYRFGIRINDIYINQNIDTSNWNIGYYGTDLNTAISIINNQRIIFSNSNAIYMSPSIKYAKLFSVGIPFKSKSINIAFQCRIKPGSFKINRAPDNFYDFIVDDNFSEDEIEWVIDKNSVIVPFGFLISF